MRAYHLTAPHVAGSSVQTWLTWLGGGERRELHERHERSAHAVAGVVVVANAALTWVVTTLAVVQATHQPLLAVVPFTLAFALLLGAISRMTGAGPARRAARRGTVAVVLIAGAIVGEFASLVMLSGSIDHQLQQQAVRDADSAPAVVQATSALQRARDERVAVDSTVDLARTHRDEALVIARCEYRPTPACPQTRITGEPGSGPETRTANEILEESQRELDSAIAGRDRRAPDLDVRILNDERVLAASRQGAMAETDHSLGARWVAMQQLASVSVSALVLRLLSIGFFALLAVLPTILALWRGETTHDRHAHARAERERAELTADTEIAVKRAEVRAATETMWAEQRLAQARLALEAQTEIERAQTRNRVRAAIADTIPDYVVAVDDIYLPIAVEAEAASLAATQSIDAPAMPQLAEADNLPAVVEQPNAPAAVTISTIPDVTRAAARWIRPLVPGFIARALDTSTHPLRIARQVIEEVEEITFSFKRTHKLTVHSEESSDIARKAEPIARPSARDIGASARRLSPERTDVAALASHSGKPRRELTERDGPAELRATDGPGQLPPGE